MTTPGVKTAEVEETFTLPPRHPTRLVRYTRRSKIVTAGLSFMGLASLIFLILHSLPNDDSAEITKRHPPKVHDVDTMGRISPGALLDKITGSGSDHETSTSAEALNQQDDHTIQLAPAPDPDVTENTELGDLPRISEDGRQPWQVYSRPFNISDKRPRLAVLITDLGLQRGVTDIAVTHMPTNVTLAFDVQSPAIGAWCARARQEGHEFLLSIPMEPFDYPHSDPGPHALLTTLSNTVNLEKFSWALRQASGYVGITTTTGSRFTTETEKFKPIMQVLRQRGLMMVDTHIAPHSATADLARDLHVPVAIASERLDENMSPEEIDSALQELKQAARLNGKAVVVVTPLPVVMERLQIWLKTLPQEGIALAPVSAVIQ